MLIAITQLQDFLLLDLQLYLGLGGIGQQPFMQGFKPVYGMREGCFVDIDYQLNDFNSK